MSGKQRILIVDDEKDLVEALTIRLEAAGYETAAAYDGIEGMSRLRSFKPDLVVLDVMMPRLDGFQFCRMVKFDEKLSSIPIIILTARGQVQDKMTASEVLADEYVKKPFDGPQLVEMIGRLIKEKGKIGE